MLHSPHQVSRLIGSPECAFKPPAMASKRVVFPISHSYEALELNNLRRCHCPCRICSLWSATICGGRMARGRGCSRCGSCTGQGLVVHASRTSILRRDGCNRVRGYVVGFGVVLLSEQVALAPARRSWCSGLGRRYYLVGSRPKKTTTHSTVLTSCSVMFICSCGRSD